MSDHDLDEALRQYPDLLLKIGERLGERYALRDVVYLTKPIFSRPAPDEQIEQLKRCDVVVTALAD